MIRFDPFEEPDRPKPDEPLICATRELVRTWRASDYSGATETTRGLLRRWALTQRLFFCQREAVETVIYLREIAPFKPELPNEARSQLRDQAGFERLACQMATGTGKTAVMAALIAWWLLNHFADPRDARFASEILVLCPGLMVKKRLEELDPHRGDASTYRLRDLVDSVDMAILRRGRIALATWHALIRRDLDSAFGVGAKVVDRGLESDEVMARRILGGRCRGLLVLDDEAHHAHQEGVQGATVWAEGLAALHSARNLALCVDLSATPRDLGSGRSFPWVVSRFDLKDAVASGLVKQPVTPVEMPALPWSTGAKEILEAARPALDAMVARYLDVAELWREEVALGQRAGSPPVFAVVCKDIALARAIHHDLKAKVPAFKDAVRLDSRSALDLGTGPIASETELQRWIGATVGLEAWPGHSPPPEWIALAEARGLDPEIPPGGQVTCVVSVAMLTEGWDARTVTHLVGLRPFESELLIEQVVGRGLRRSRPGDWTTNEVVEVCGIPLERLGWLQDRPAASIPDIDLKVTASAAETSSQALEFPPGRGKAVPKYLPAGTEAVPGPPPGGTKARHEFPSGGTPGIPDALIEFALAAVATQQGRRQASLFDAALLIANTLAAEFPPHVAFPMALAALKHRLARAVTPCGVPARID